MVQSPQTPQEHSTPTISASESRLCSARGALLYALAYLVFWQLALRLLPDRIEWVIASTLLSLALVIAFTGRVAACIRTPRALAWNLAASTCVIFPMRLLYVSGHLTAPWNLLLQPGLPDLLLVWFAAGVGVLLSRLLRGANMIPPVATVLALVDIWTVLLGGPVHQVMTNQSPAAKAITKAMTVALPAPRTGAAPMLVVGFADFLFIAFFVAAVLRFITQPGAYRKTILSLIAVLTIYMAIVLFSPMWSLPALLPMAVTMIAIHWRNFQYTRSEAFALLYAGLFIVVLAAAFWWFGRHKEPPTAVPQAALLVDS